MHTEGPWRISCLKRPCHRWPFRKLSQIDGIGIARVSNFNLGKAIADGRLVPLLESSNPGAKEVFHAVFVDGANMPARIRVLVDYLVERMSDSYKTQ